MSRLTNVPISERVLRMVQLTGDGSTDKPLTIDDAMAILIAQNEVMIEMLGAIEGRIDSLHGDMIHGEV